VDIVGGNGMSWKTVLVKSTESTSRGLANYEVENYDELHSIIFPSR